MGKVLYMDIKRDNPLINWIFVKFDDPKAGNSRKDGRLQGELKECVTITAETKSFPYRYRNKAGCMERKQYPLVIAYAITIHKSQGSTLEFIVGDLNCATDKGPNAAPVNRGQVYALLSLATSRGKIKLINFEPKHIKCNMKQKKKWRE